MQEIFQKEKNTLIIIIILVVFFLLRIIFFVNTYGGVEHDSGWYLGVAKNVAERGIYASFTNTIGSNNPGANSTIHGRFGVQDAHGFMYFPAGVTVGPGYVFPEALILKIFGNGWWQYRLWPLLAFSILLFLSFYIIKKIGGYFALIIFALWLWVIPQYYIGYSFEAFSESIAMMFFLSGAWILFGPFSKKKKYYFLAGFLFACSYLTKNLFLLPISSLGIVVLYDLVKNRNQIRKALFKWIVLLLGIILPIILFQVYQYISLMITFGGSGVDAVKEDYRLHFLLNGSGIENFKNLDVEFIRKKINIWTNVGLNNSYIAWSLLLILPFFVGKKVEKKYRLFLYFLTSATYVSFLWYVFLSPTGWARHAWQAIFMGMMLIAVFIGILLENSLKKRQYIFGIFIVLVMSFSLSFNTLFLSPLLNNTTIQKWKEISYTRGIQGFPSTPLLSKTDQDELINYFKNNVSEKDRIYYAGWFIHPEASTVTNKVFYTLDRYFYFNQKNPDGGKSFIIFGPYQKGMWSIMPSHYILDKEKELCMKKVFENNSYTLCILKENLIYNNPAYQ